MELGFFPCSLNMNNKNDVDKMLENSQSKTFMSNMKISQDLKDHFYVVEIGLPLLKLPFLPEKGGLPLLERSLLLDRGRSVRTLKTT